MGHQAILDTLMSKYAVNMPGRVCDSRKQILCSMEQPLNRECKFDSIASN